MTDETGATVLANTKIGHHSWHSRVSVKYRYFQCRYLVCCLLSGNLAL